MEEHPGYQKIKIAPIPDERLDWLRVSFESRCGQIRSEWIKEGASWRYDITTPVEAEIVIGDTVHAVQPGNIVFIVKGRILEKEIFMFGMLYTKA